MVRSAARGSPSWPASAWTTIAVTWWPTTSCSSRATRCAAPARPPGRGADRPPPRGACAGPAAADRAGPQAGRATPRRSCRRVSETSDDEGDTAPASPTGPAEPRDDPGSSTTETKTSAPTVREPARCRRHEPQRTPPRPRHRGPPAWSDEAQHGDAATEGRQRRFWSPRCEATGHQRRGAAPPTGGVREPPDRGDPPGRRCAHSTSLVCRRRDVAARRDSVPGYRSGRPRGPSTAGGTRPIGERAGDVTHDQPPSSPSRASHVPTAPVGPVTTVPNLITLVRTVRRRDDRPAGVAHATASPGGGLRRLLGRRHPRRLAGPRLGQETRLGAVFDIVERPGLHGPALRRLSPHLRPCCRWAGLPALVHGGGHDAVAVVPVLAAGRPQRLPPRRPPGLAAQLVAGAKAVNTPASSGISLSAPTPRPRRRRCRAAVKVWSALPVLRLSRSRAVTWPADSRSRSPPARPRRCCRSSTPRCTPWPPRRAPVAGPVALVLALAPGRPSASCALRDRPPRLGGRGRPVARREGAPAAGPRVCGAGLAAHRRPARAALRRARPAAAGRGQPRRRCVRPTSLGVRRRSACSAAPRGSPCSPCPRRTPCADPSQDVR